MAEATLGTKRGRRKGLGKLLEKVGYWDEGKCLWLLLPVLILLPLVGREDRQNAWELGFS